MKFISLALSVSLFFFFFFISFFLSFFSSYMFTFLSFFPLSPFFICEDAISRQTFEQKCEATILLVEKIHWRDELKNRKRREKKRKRKKERKQKDQCVKEFTWKEWKVKSSIKPDKRGWRGGKNFYQSKYKYFFKYFISRVRKIFIIDRSDVSRKRKIFEMTCFWPV